MTGVGVALRCQRRALTESRSWSVFGDGEREAFRRRSGDEEAGTSTEEVVPTGHRGRRLTRPPGGGRADRAPEASTSDRDLHDGRTPRGLRVRNGQRRGRGPGRREGARREPLEKTRTRSARRERRDLACRSNRANDPRTRPAAARVGITETPAAAGPSAVVADAQTGAPVHREVDCARSPAR